MILSPLIYTLLKIVIALVVSFFIVCILRKKILSGSTKQVCIILGVVCGILFYFLISACFNTLSYHVISVYNRCKYSERIVIGKNTSKAFAISPDIPIEFGKVYIENMSDYGVIITSVSYSSFPYNLSGQKYGESGEMEIIGPNTVGLCERYPDYFFDEPKEITVSREKNQKSSEPEIKWVLKYSAMPL